MKRLLLLGGGGFAKEVAELAETNNFNVIGFLDDSQNPRLKANHLGTISSLRNHLDSFDYLFLAIGATNEDSIKKRKSLIKSLNSYDLNFPTLISPNALISPGVTISQGVFIAHGVKISVDAVIGEQVILNTSAVVGHDSSIGDFTVVAPLAFLAGCTSIGNQCLIGPSSQILQGLEVGSNSLISSGSLVNKSIPSGTKVFQKRTKYFYAR